MELIFRAPVLVLGFALSLMTTMKAVKTLEISLQISSTNDVLSCTKHCSTHYPSKVSTGWQEKPNKQCFLFLFVCTTMISHNVEANRANRANTASQLQKMQRS